MLAFNSQRACLDTESNPVGASTNSRFIVTILEIQPV